MAEELKEGDVVLCIEGAAQKAVDEGAYSRFFPIQGKAYTIKKVEFDDDAYNTFVSLVEDTFYETPSWDVCRFLKIENGAEFTQTFQEFANTINNNLATIDEAVKLPNAQGGIKFDLGKKDYTLLLQDLKVVVDEVTDVLELGAKKYARGNYKLIELDRYNKALFRHVMAYVGGEQSDPETGKHHLAHAICCAAFIIERELGKGQNNGC